MLIMLLSLTLAHAVIPERTFDTNEILADEAISPKQRADRLSRVGETLMMPQSLDAAAEVFGKVLELDRHNPRANFYLRLFGPLFTAKGIMTRVEPLVAATGNASFSASHQEGLKKTWPFFRDGAKDIATDRDVRKFLRELGDAWGCARAYFATEATPLMLRTTWLTSHYVRRREEPLMDFRFEDGQWVGHPNGQTQVIEEDVDGNDLAARECTVESPKPGVYHVAACPHLTVQNFALDYADIEALRGYAAGHQLLGILDTAYNTDGASALLANWMNLGRPLTDQEITKTLIEAGAGALEPDHKLGSVRELGTDIVAAVKWLTRYQKDLCQPRPGYVFAQGACLTSSGFTTDDLGRVMAMAEATLGDNPIDAANGHGFATQVRLSRIFAAPPAHLRPLAPNLFDAFGNVVGLPDPSLNGIFVNADAPKFYRLNAR